MLDPIASPGDSPFYLHHTWLDKGWWDWQALDLPARLTEMGGPNVQGPFKGLPEGFFDDAPEFPVENGNFVEDIPVQIPEGDPGGRDYARAYPQYVWRLSERDYWRGYGYWGSAVML